MSSSGSGSGTSYSPYSSRYSGYSDSAKGTGTYSKYTSTSSSGSSPTVPSCCYYGSCSTQTKSKCKKVQVGHNSTSTSASADSEKDGLPKTFKVVQMTGVSPLCGGVIGYVYTYEVRKRHRTVKKNVHPFQPYKVIVVREEGESCPKNNNNNSPEKFVPEGPEAKVKEANEEIEIANQQIAQALFDKKKAQQRKKEAEVWRWKNENNQKNTEGRSQSKSKSRRRSSAINDNNCKNDTSSKPRRIVSVRLLEDCW